MSEKQENPWNKVVQGCSREKFSISSHKIDSHMCCSSDFFIHQNRFQLTMILLSIAMLIFAFLSVYCRRKISDNHFNERNNLISMKEGKKFVRNTRKFIFYVPDYLRKNITNKKKISQKSPRVSEEMCASKVSRIQSTSWCSLARFSLLFYFIFIHPISNLISGFKNFSSLLLLMREEKVQGWIINNDDNDDRRFLTLTRHTRLERKFGLYEG